MNRRMLSGCLVTVVFSSTVALGQLDQGTAAAVTANAGGVVAQVQGAPQGGISQSPEGQLAVQTVSVLPKPIIPHNQNCSQAEMPQIYDAIALPTGVNATSLTVQVNGVPITTTVNGTQQTSYSYPTVIFSYSQNKDMSNATTLDPAPLYGILPASNFTPQGFSTSGVYFPPAGIPLSPSYIADQLPPGQALFTSSITTIAAGSYYFTVKAFSSLNNQCYTTITPGVPFTVINPPTKEPQNLEVAKTGGPYPLSWSPVAGATSYNLKSSGNQNAATDPKTIMSGIKTTSVVPQGLGANEDAYIYVSAVNGAGQGPNSHPGLKVKTPPQVPSKVYPAQRYGVAWSPVPGATSYVFNLDGMVTPLTQSSEEGRATYDCSKDNLCVYYPRPFVPGKNAVVVPCSVAAVNDTGSQRSQSAFSQPNSIALPPP